MKKSLFFIGLMWISLSSNAQITLTQSSFPASVLGTDTIVNTTVGSSFPSMVSMADATWDLSIVTDTTVPFLAYRVATSPYQFADSNRYAFSTYAYNGNVQCSITTSGFYEYGILIPNTGYSLASLLGSSADSLIIVAQSDTFSMPETVISFPASLNSTWSSNYETSFNFLLNIPIDFLNYAPGIVKSYVTETDTVKGWGKMRVKNLDGTPSSYFNVLQVQKTVVTVDSFFLNGTLAPSALLTVLGFNQGQIVKSYFQDYYRPEEVTPLAEVHYNDSTFSHPTVAYIHTQRLVNEGVPGILNESKVRVSPNPVSGRSVSVELPPNSGEWTYELIDMNGTADKTGPLIMGAALFELPEGLASGIYYIKLSNNGSLFCVKTIEVIR